MVSNKSGNYHLYQFSNSALAFALMLFWMVFLWDFGGSIEQFGFALGLMMLAQSITSYFVGNYSDKFGRKISLIIRGFILTGLIFAYTLISSLIELYILQIINGITSSVQATMEPAF